MSTTFLSSSEPCNCDDVCGTFVNSIDILPPSTGFTCPLRVVMTTKFPATTDPDGPQVAECNKIVCIGIVCDETLIKLRDKLIARYPLSASA